MNITTVILKKYIKYKKQTQRPSPNAQDEGNAKSDLPAEDAAVQSSHLC